MRFSLKSVGFAFVLLFLAIPALQAQSGEPGSSDTLGAPVTIDGEQLFMLQGISSYPARERARTVRDRIIDIARDETLSTDDLRLEQVGEITQIMLGERLVLGIVDIDAENEGISRQLLADSYKNRIARAIDQYRTSRSRDVLFRNGLYAAVATVVFAFALWGVLRLYGVVHRWTERRLQKSIKDLASKTFNLFHPGQAWRLLNVTLRLLRLVLVVGLIYFFLNAVLGLFPWTRPLASVLFQLVIDPLESIGRGFLSALPNLFFLVILFFVVRFLLKLIRAFFNGVRYGRIHFENFDADWAMPTYRIVRFLVIAFSIVIAYPYIPGSDSLAFKGVSVFLGVLLSLGSSSFIANTIAGLTMTYRGAFKEGDFIQVGDVRGTVREIKLMVTRLRTPKNEIVILPNA